MTIHVLWDLSFQPDIPLAWFLLKTVRQCGVPERLAPASPLDPVLAYGQSLKTAKVVPEIRPYSRQGRGAPSIARELNLRVLISPPEDHSFLRQDFPATQRAAWETIWIPQPALLGDEQDMHEIATAIRKIQKHATELA